MAARSLHIRSALGAIVVLSIGACADRETTAPEMLREPGWHTVQSSGDVPARLGSGDFERTLRTEHQRSAVRDCRNGRRERRRGAASLRPSFFPLLASSS